MSDFDSSAQLSRLCASVEEAAIIRMAQKARDLRSRGANVVSLTIGEPDFDTPAAIRNAATEAMNAGHTHYAPIAGIPELRQALAKKLQTENGLTYTADEIVVSNGAKQSITNAMFALIDPGDEVILLAPYWVAYDGIVRMAGATPRVVAASAEEGFKVPAARLHEALSERTKLVIINTPCNPTGAVYSRNELAELAAVITDHPRAMVLSDEIYEYIVFDDAKHVSLASLPGMRERTIVVNGLSKGFAMTGWRIGYGAAPAPVAKAMGKVQGTFTAGGNAFVQHAAVAALTGDRIDVEAMRASYQRRRKLVVDGLGAIPGIKAPRPDGAFYIFPDISAYLGKTAGNRPIDSAEDMAEWLLEKHHVATVPGTTFGAPGCIRLSFAASDADITEGLKRITAGLSELV